MPQHKTGRCVDAENNYHVVAQTRRRELSTRVGVGFFLFLTALALTRSHWSAVWYGAVLAGQSADLIIFAPLLNDPNHSVSAWRRAACTLSVSANAFIYASLALLLWIAGGEGGRVFAMVMLCGSLLHVTLHTHQITRLLLAAVVPMSLFFFGLPIAAWVVAPQTAAMSSLAMLAAGVLYLAHLANSVRQSASATTLLMEAKAQAEAQRLLAEQERETAAHANAAKSDFLATISHEIRTPMNAVVSAANLLQRTHLSPDQAECVSILLGGGEVLIGLINDVLDLSKIEAGKMTLEDAPLDLADALTTMTKLWEPRAEEKGLRLRLELADDLPEAIRADPLRLKQILFNLLSNAMKFTDLGEVTLRVGQAVAEDGGQVLVFDVRDTGCGIAETGLARLFQGFEQADAGVTRRYGGTGLGLSISRRLAQLMGGDLTATSHLDVGSTFRLTLPLRLAVLPQKAVAAHGGDLAMLGTLDLLVADDHPVNRRVLALLLEPLGWRLTFAEDGAEAVRIAGAAPFDAILMDMQMPVMDGLSATKVLRASPGPNQSTPVLALTANALEHHRQAWAEIGVHRFLSKPINLTDLIEAISDACAAPTADEQQSARA